MSITYNEMCTLLKQVEQSLVSENHFLYTFYCNELKNEKKFYNDMLKLFSDCDLLNAIHTSNDNGILTPEVTFYEILWYVYLLPWESQWVKTKSSNIPDFMEDDTYEDFHFARIRRKKIYYLCNFSQNEDGNTYCGKTNVTAYAQRHLDAINSVSMETQTVDDIVLNIKTKILTQWSVVDKKTKLYGEPLLNFPLLSEMTLASKRGFFLLDLGCYVFQKLTELMSDDGAALIIPSEILKNQIISFSKTTVVPDVLFNESNEHIEFRSSNYHTIFDAISLVNELSAAIDDGDSQEEIIQNAIMEIKKENRMFANVTTRDFVGLSNIIKMFFQGNGEDVKYMTLGEMTDTILNGISNEHLRRHRKEEICDALEVIHKWSAYAFELGAIGRITPFNYVAGEYTNPHALARAIRTGKVQFLPDKDDSQKNKLIASDISVDIDSSVLEKVPIKLEMSNLFRECIEHDQMSRQFSYYYELIVNDYTKVLYYFIEIKRKESSYPEKMYISYKELSQYFVVNNRKLRFLSYVEKGLTELLEIGVLKKYTQTPQGSAYILEFPNIL